MHQTSEFAAGEQGKAVRDHEISYDTRISNKHVLQ